MNGFAKIRFFFITSLVSAMLFSCDPDRHLDPETILEFVHVQRFGTETRLDSLSVRVSFQDGDGNIGLAKHDTLPPFVGKYSDNLFFYVYDKISENTYELMRVEREVDVWDTIVFSFKTPIFNVPKNTAVTGTFDIVINDKNVQSMQVPGRSKNGIIRFEIYMYDRDLVRSNIVVTPDIPIR